MRSAIVQLSAQPTSGQQRQTLRAAVRQLERAEVYLAAVAFMDIDDREAQRAISRLRADVESLRRHLDDQRVTIHS
jgi:lysylphosphatidylglycerol synthetase-like protein (DUF2156 family)